MTAQSHQGSTPLINASSRVSDPLVRSLDPEASSSQAEGAKAARPTNRKDSHNTERLKWEDYIIRDRKISAEAYRVGSFIAGHLNEKTRTAWPSVQLIQEALGLCRSVVFECVNELLVAGHLVRGKRKVSGNHNEYSLAHGPITQTERRPSRRSRQAAQKKPRASEAASTFDRTIVDRFLLEYPLSGQPEDAAAISAGIARAVADGLAFDELLAAADRYRVHCTRNRIPPDLIVAPDAFLADRRWLDGTLFLPPRQAKVAS